MAGTRIIGIYPDRDTALAVQRELAGMVEERVIHLDDPIDARHAKIAEDQAQGGTVGPLPATPPMTGSTMKASMGGALLGGAIGAVAMGLIGLFPLVDLALLPRLLLFAIIGGAGGSVVGWLSGGYVGGHVATKPLAADRGVALSVDVDDDRALQVMAEHHPIRLDRVGADGSLVEHVADEDDGTLYAKRLGAALVGHDNPHEMVPEDPSNPRGGSGRDAT